MKTYLLTVDKGLGRVKIPRHDFETKEEFEKCVKELLEGVNNTMHESIWDDLSCGLMPSDYEVKEKNDDYAILLFNINL